MQKMCNAHYFSVKNRIYSNHVMFRILQKQ